MDTLARPSPPRATAMSRVVSSCRGLFDPAATPRQAPPGRLLVASNRLPVSAIAQGDGVSLTPSVGGLATGLHGVHARSESLWIGGIGIGESLAPAMEQALRQKLHSLRLSPVRMSADEVAVFYDRICNAVLWPAVHDRLDQLPLVVEGWNVYEAVNARFADAVAARYRPGDLVWVHDYHLLRVPALIRARLPAARVGFFLHTPFPHPDTFFALPCRRWLLEGMLGADVIGFHTRAYRDHCAVALRRLFGVGMVNEVVTHDGRQVRLGVFPMGVNATVFDHRSAERDVVAETLRLRRRDRNVRLLVGIDRLDYSKGIPRRLLALERLLTRHPEWSERVRFVQIAVPSRAGLPAYKRVRQAVEELVASINGRFGTQRWTPIRYVCHSVSDVELSALYRAADVLLVTPLRDGMNLVAKEFVASRSDGDGVLVLSEFAGAAEELTSAVLVNPYDVDGMAEAIHCALIMPREERRKRMAELRAHVMTHDVSSWAAGFLAALGEGDPS